MAKPQVFRSYTPAFRYPLVIGKVNGLQMPFRFTVQQAAAFIASIIFGFKTRDLWSVILPVSGLWSLLIIGGVGFSAAWLLQHKQVEGRHPIAYLLGWIKYLNQTKPSQDHNVYKTVGHQPRQHREIVESDSRAVLVESPVDDLSGWEVFTNA